MHSSTSMTMSRLTGPHRIVDSRELPRLVTESWSQELLAVPTSALGQTRRGRPPPDVVSRVLSTFALLGALWLALAIQCAFG